MSYWRGVTSWLKCRIGLHVWGGVLDDGPGPGAWRCCAACGKYQEGAYDGIAPFWRTTKSADPAAADTAANPK